MKKYILPLLAAGFIGFTSCNESTTTETENTATEVKNEVENTATEVKNEATEIKNKVENNTPAAVAATTTMTVDRMTHDFGTITDDKKAETTFTITNTGNQPLIIASAKGSCGCTVPQFPKEPILPGKTGTIDVSFDPKGKAGAQTKTVTIIANTEPATTTLNIKSVINKLEEK